MINKDNIDVARMLLGNEISNNLERTEIENDSFSRVCEARGILDVLSQKLGKEFRKELRKKVKDGNKNK